MERLTYRTTKGEAMGNSSVADIGDILEKLAEYEDLEDKLNGVSVKQVVDGFINTVKNQTNEEYEHGRILTNAEADKWNEYKQLDEQGLLLRLPVKAGDIVYIISRNNEIIPLNVHGIDIRKDDFTILAKNEKYCGYSILSLLGKYKSVDWFITQAEAERKLKEMEV